MAYAYGNVLSDAFIGDGATFINILSNNNVQAQVSVSACAANMGLKHKGQDVQLGKRRTLRANCPGLEESMGHMACDGTREHHQARGAR